MFEIKVEAEFEAAHRIVNYPGKCDRLHGHNWKVEMKIIGKVLDDLGMLIDFKEAKAALKEATDELDHRFLNELEPFCTMNPTAENIAQYIYDKLKKHDLFQTAPVHLAAVCVWESPRACVTYSEDD